MRSALALVREEKEPGRGIANDKTGYPGQLRPERAVDGHKAEKLCLSAGNGTEVTVAYFLALVSP